MDAASSAARAATAADTAAVQSTDRQTVVEHIITVLLRGVQFRPPLGRSVQPAAGPPTMWLQRCRKRLRAVSQRWSTARTARPHCVSDARAVLCLYPRLARGRRRSGGREERLPLYGSGSSHVYGRCSGVGCRGYPWGPRAHWCHRGLRDGPEVREAGAGAVGMRITVRYRTAQGLSSCARAVFEHDS